MKHIHFWVHNNIGENQLTTLLLFFFFLYQQKVERCLVGEEIAAEVVQTCRQAIARLMLMSVAAAAAF